MDAGRELDILVHEKVLGWTDIVTHTAYASGKLPDGRTAVVRPVSVDIGCAWEVVEAMRNKEYQFALIADDRCLPCDYAAEFSRDDSNIGETTYMHGARSLIASHAICLAALEALGLL